MTRRILIACVGNIFLGDDGFGVEVARQLALRPLPEGVEVADFGIRGLDLTYTLLEARHDAVILVDAAPRGGAPGTLYVLEPEPEATDKAAARDDPTSLLIDAHDMDPEKVLRLMHAMGRRLRHLLLVGCETRPVQSTQDIAQGLSPPVRAAVPEALRAIEQLIARLLPAGNGAPAPQAPSPA